MESINKFLREYIFLLHQEKYISKSIIDELLYKYSAMFYENLENSELKELITTINKKINNHNNNFIKKKLKQDKKYFDKMFYDIDPNIILDKEQRKIILEDEDNTLVIAGAGSGKTTTMTAKVKYLVDKKNIDPREILILAFTNQATLELKERINNKFKINAQILTFHKLSMHILKKTTKINFEIITDKELEDIIEDYLINYIFNNKKKLKKIIGNFNQYLKFTHKIYKYDSFQKYYNNYIHNLYYKHFYHIKKYNMEKINENLSQLKALDNNIYNNTYQVLIANYLYTNNITYRFTNNIFYLFEDSFIYYKERNIIHLEPNNYIKNIIKISKKKQKSNELKKEKSNKEIFFALMLNNKKSLYKDFIVLIKDFILKFKNMGYSNFNCLIKQNKKFKNHLEIIKDIYEYYENYKKTNKKIDFNDMINLAYNNLENINLKYKYIIIDEYQDISFQRYKLIEKIVNIFNPKIIAVGDDFQAIYSFSGSNIKLFTDFYDLMGYASICKITKTYRNSQQLINIAGSFVMKNKKQLKKNLISNKSIDKPIEIIYYTNNKSKALLNIIKKIIEDDKNTKILLLGRYKKDIYTIIDNHNFKIINKKIRCITLKLDLDFFTIHAAKGLGYDNVILLNFNNDNMGFPSQIEDNDLVKLLYRKEEYEHAEERRLFYVALTRTKNKIYIMCPKEEKKQSVFIKEILNEEVVEVNFDF